MSNFIQQEMFLKFQQHIDKELELKDKIRTLVHELEQNARQASIHLQIIHSDLEKVPASCLAARQCFEKCKEIYQQIAELIPPKQFYKYCDLWYYNTQRLVFLIALTIYLEAGFLVTRETAAKILGLKTSQAEGFHLEIEDYLSGILQLTSELARFATNAVTLGDYSRPLNISRFVAELNSGFRLLNLKNDSLRKRFDALKYDVKRIEEVVYDLSVRGLAPQVKQLDAGVAEVIDPSP